MKSKPGTTTARACCRKCGCTPSNPCQDAVRGPCYWVTNACDLCSHCAMKSNPPAPRPAPNDELHTFTIPASALAPCQEVRAVPIPFIRPPVNPQPETPQPTEETMSETIGGGGPSGGAAASVADLLRQLEDLDPTVIDKEIETLKQRIKELKRIKHLTAQLVPRSSQTGSLDLDQVSAWLRKNGPQKPAAIARHFRVHSTLVWRTLKTSKQFKRLTDGTYQTV